MRKLLIAASSLLFGATQLDATTLTVANYTGRTIRVAIVGSEQNFNSTNSVRIVTNSSVDFNNWGWMPGPLRFVFEDDANASTKAKGYPVWESYDRNSYTKDPNYIKSTEKIAWAKNNVSPTFPVLWGGLVRIHIGSHPTDKYTFAKKSYKWPVLQVTWPVWFNLNALYPFKKLTSKSRALGEGGTIEW